MTCEREQSFSSLASPNPVAEARGIEVFHSVGIQDCCPPLGLSNVALGAQGENGNDECLQEDQAFPTSSLCFADTFVVAQVPNGLAVGSC